jgi:hypothetical protein
VTVTNIPDDHHFIRHCKARQYFLRDGKIRPYPEAFHLRPATSTMRAEDTLSGVYYEWFDGTLSEKMKACCYFIRMEIKVSLRQRPPGIDVEVRDSCLKSGSMIVSTIR